MQLYRERNGVWYVTVTENGRRARRSLKTKSKLEAKQKVAKLELESHEAAVFGKEPERRFREMMTLYLDAKKDQRGFGRMQDGAKPLVSFFGDCTLVDIDKPAVSKYVRWRSEKVQSGTIARELGVLKAAFNFVAEEYDWQVRNPVTKKNMPKEPKGRVRYITRDEARRLIQVAREPRFDGRFNRSTALADFIELALNTGCRKQELLGLKWSDVDLSTRLLRLPMTKSGEWQTVPINETAREVLVRRMRLRAEVCPETSFVFFHETARPGADVGGRILDLQHSFNRACREAGIEDFRIHDLRHTFASWLVMEGVDIFKVSKLLRHGSVQMTERYAHLSPDHLHEAVAVLGFRAENGRSEKTTPLRLVKEVAF